MNEQLPEHWPGGPGDPEVLQATLLKRGAADIKISLGEDSPWLEGHFPERAVLPGIVQLKWALQLALQIWPDLGEVRTISNIKFQKPILPPAILLLELRLNEDATRLDFGVYRDNERCALGRFRLS